MSNVTLIEAFWAFDRAVADLRRRGYIVDLVRLAVDEDADTVAIQAVGTIRPFYNLLPAVTVRVDAVSWFRMIQR